jgi:topoisomerase IA-like protein
MSDGPRVARITADLLQWAAENFSQLEGYGYKNGEDGERIQAGTARLGGYVVSAEDLRSLAEFCDTSLRHVERDAAAFKVLSEQKRRRLQVAEEKILAEFQQEAEEAGVDKPVAIELTRSE